MWEVKVNDRANVFGKLGALFGWTDNLIPRISGTILPTIDMYEIAGEDRNKAVTVNLSGTLDSLVAAFTVPQGERWKLHRIAFSGTNGAGTRPILKISGYDLNFQAKATAESYANLQDIELKENDTVNLNATAQGGDNAVWCQLCVRIYKITG